MFPFLSTDCVFHIVELMWTVDHQSHCDCVGYNVHGTAAEIFSSKAARKSVSWNAFSCILLIYVTIIMTNCFE